MKFHETNGDGVFDSCEHGTIKNLIEAIGDSKKTAKGYIYETDNKTSISTDNTGYGRIYFFGDCFWIIVTINRIRTGLGIFDEPVYICRFGSVFGSGIIGGRGNICTCCVADFFTEFQTFVLWLVNDRKIPGNRNPEALFDIWTDG